MRVTAGASAVGNRPPRVLPVGPRHRQGLRPRRVPAEGLDRFRASIARQAPDLADRVGEISDWDAVKTLSVRIDRARRWYAPGVLLIGDAAHAMSPIGGVGINLAVQDAVAAARLLAGPVLDRRLTAGVLARVQRRRLPPTVGTQALQVILQRALIGRVLSRRRADRRTGSAARPAPVSWTAGSSGPVIGIGLRPERLD